jgi:FkbM family methyltransferase
MSYMQSLKSVIQNSERLNAALMPAFMSLVHPRVVRRNAKEHGLTAEFNDSTIEIADDRRIVRLARQHAIYAKDVVNDFDFFHGAVIPEIKDGTALVDYSLPKFHDIPGYPLHAVFFNALAEPLVTANQYLEFAALEEGSIALDLGAYSGLTSILFREQCGASGSVIAIDADPANIIAIKKNLELYSEKTGRRVELLEGAVWNHDDGIHFSAEGNLGSSATECVGNRIGAATPVPSFRLATVASRHRLPKVDFIKCDIEGAESVIFKDAEFFRVYRPKIIVEVHRLQGVFTTDKVKSDLSKYGYRFELIEQIGSTQPLLRCTPS